MASDSQFRRVHHQKNPENLRQLDATIWKACAGTWVQIPSVHSRVYYFPQGHIEHCSSPRGISLSPIATSRPTIPCRVLEVQHLADPDTDEVYAKIRLEPIRTGFLNPEPSGLGESGGNGNGSGNGNGLVSFAKVLTPSDANNGGGFSVPRFCADSILPKLDFDADPPVQNVRISDVHGEVWEFRHIYRGTPRRHLLTTGWSKFVNSKKLIAGDSVVFMKCKTTEELFVGVRKAVKSNDSGWANHHATGNGPTSGGGGSTTVFGFSRSGKKRVSAEAVVEAVERAASNMVFEVVYYPRAGLPDFVVAAEKVEASMRMCLSPGDEVKMAMETEDSSRMTWFKGGISSLVVPDHGPWRGSPWRSLQVSWHDTEILRHMKRVSPWQVEYDPSAPKITALPPAKRLRASNSSELLTGGEGDILYHSMGWNPLNNQLNSSHLNYNTFPAGMQGARHNPFCVPNVPNIMDDGAHQTRPTDHLENVAHNWDTDLNIGSPSSDKPSPDGQSSVQLCGPDTSRQNSRNLSKKASITSFQLFGKTIQMEQSLADDMNCAEYDCKTGVVKSITSSVVEAFAL